MNEKTIEKSFDEYMKKNYTENYLSNYKREVIDNQHCDFANGVEYYLKNTWHDKSEIPEYGKECLVFLNDPMREGWHIGRIEKQGKNVGKWNIYGYFTPASHNNILYWAYIEDLLTNKQEE